MKEEIKDFDYEPNVAYSQAYVDNLKLENQQLKEKNEKLEKIIIDLYEANNKLFNHCILINKEVR